MKKRIISMSIIFIFFLQACSVIDDLYLVQNAIDNFKGTQGYEIAKAVMHENVPKIKEICMENSGAMYVEDNEYHYTVLHWAVGLKKFKSVKALLEAGMNPNVQSSVGGETPLFIATKNEDVDITFLKLLLDYGADPNIGTTAVILPDMIQADGRSTPVFSSFIDGQTPLMTLPTLYIPAKKANPAKAKFLIEKAHADINKKDINGSTAAIRALRFSDIDMAYYLIVECKATVTDPYYFPESVRGRERKKIPQYPVYALREWLYPLDSPEYKKKMDIVKEFEKQGVDYWNTSIPDSILTKIRDLYPDNWKEYSEKY
ncbi:ankyrin repeat domain-containing protein [Treponema pedis]|nr:ankyrin repeat domain-containing protein [Treponema pedis]